MAGCLGIGLIVVSNIWDQLPTFIFIVSFFLLAIIHQGIRLGRQTYIIDLAQGDTRTQHVAISNSIIGFCILLLGGLGAIISLFSVSVIISILSICAFAVAFAGTRLADT